MAVCVLVTSLLLAAQAYAQLDDSTRENVRRVIPAVGIIFARDSSEPPGQYPRLRGSGVVIRSDGIIVTNYHVIKHDDDENLYDELHFSLTSSAATQGGEKNRFRLSILATSKQHDLALLKVSADGTGRSVVGMIKFPTIEFGDSRKLKMMDDLIIIGYPDKAGSDVTVNKGMVEGIDTVNEWIKTDARLMRGNSGGAAVNSEGRLVGIPSKVVVDSRPSARVTGEQEKSSGAIGFLRPSHLVQTMLERVGGSPTAEKIDGSEPMPTPAPGTNHPKAKTSKHTLLVRGTIKSSTDGVPVAGARIGLVPAGSDTVTAENLIAWGGSDSDGRFELNNPVPPGRYTLKAVAFGFLPLSREVEINNQSTRLDLKLKPKPSS